MGPDPENTVGDPDVGRTGRAVSSVLQMSGEHIGDLPVPRRFSFKISFNCTSRDK